MSDAVGIEGRLLAVGLAIAMTTGLVPMGTAIADPVPGQDAEGVEPAPTPSRETPEETPNATKEPGIEVGPAGEPALAVPAAEERQAVCAGCSSSSDTDEASDPGSGDRARPAERSLELEAETSLETPRQLAGYVSVEAETTEAVRAHQFGFVAGTTADGQPTWNRSTTSLFADWGIQAETVPYVYLGTVPTDPFAWEGDEAIVAGDLLGDEREEVAVAHVQGGVGLGVVTVLDAESGETLWFALFDGAATHLVVQDGRLVVAYESGDPRDAPTEGLGSEGATSQLRAYAFQETDDGLTVNRSWTYDSGISWARWLDVEPTEEGLAAALTDKPLGEEGKAGDLLLLSEGQVRWNRSTEAYPMELAEDPTRSQLVVHLMEDFVETVSPVEAPNLGPDRLRDRLLDLEGRDYAYRIAGFGLQTGEQHHVYRAEDRILLELAVHDLDGSGRAEWIASDLEIQTPPVDAFGASLFTGSRLQALSPTPEGGFEERWSQERERPSDTLWPVYDVRVHERSASPDLLVAGGLEGVDFTSSDIRALHAADGTLAWSSSAQMLAILHADIDGQLVGSTIGLVRETLDAGDGDVSLRRPMLARPYHSVLHEGEGSALDAVIVGTGTQGVFALDPDLDEVQWRTMLPAPISGMKEGDVTNDGDPDLLVLAGRAGLFVLDPASGEVRDHVGFPGEYVWTATIGDASGDGAHEVVVPTRSVSAYRWQAGDGLAETWTWQKSPTEEYHSTVAISEGKVFFQTTARPPSLLAPRHHQISVALDGETGEEVWVRAAVTGMGSRAHLWDSVSVLPDRGTDGDEIVVFSYRSRRGDVAGFTGDRDADSLEAPLGMLAYDAETGERVWAHNTAQDEVGSVHMGQLVHDGRVVEHGWSSTVAMNATDVDAVAVSAWTAAVLELSDSEAYLTADVDLHAWDTRILQEGSAAEPDAVLDPALFVRDFSLREAPSGTTLVAHPLDADRLSTVRSFEGVLSFSFHFLPEGLVLAQASEDPLAAER